MKIISLSNLLFESVPKGFKFEEFDDLTVAEKYKYLIDHKPEGLRSQKVYHIGEGSDRTVFVLDSKKVLKLAITKRGVLQNLHEFEMSNKYPLITAETYRIGPRNEYIISELVRELNPEEFKNRSFGFSHLNSKENQQWETYIKSDDAFVRDSYERSHWGKTVNGKYVLMDYGINNKIIWKSIDDETLSDTLLESVPKGFKFEEFDSLTVAEKYKYLINLKPKGLQSKKVYHIGEGSDRTVFVLDSKKVLKLAITRRGFMQNKQELEFSNEYPLITPHIYRISSSDEYLISELVRAATAEEFKDYFEIPFAGIENLSWQEDSPDWANLATKQLYKLLVSTDIAVGDLRRIIHWGKTSDGRIVLMDSGATRNMLDKTKKNPDIGKSLLESFPKGFNYEYFKSLGLPEKREYASTTLRLLKLGDGSSRDVYRLDSKKVLKITKKNIVNKTNKKELSAGILQNKNECEMYEKSGQAKNVLPKVFFCDPNGEYLISEIVKEFTEESEFEKASGLDWVKFMSSIYMGTTDTINNNSAKTFVKNFLFLIDNIGLNTGDFILNHFGKTADGRVVMIDTGFTNSYNATISNFYH